MLSEATGYPCQAANDASLGAEAELIFGAGCRRRAGEPDLPQRRRQRHRRRDHRRRTAAPGCLRLRRGTRPHLCPLRRQRLPLRCHGLPGNRSLPVPPPGTGRLEQRRHRRPRRGARRTAAAPRWTTKSAASSLYLGIALRNAVNIFNPEAIVLDGFLGTLHALAPTSLDATLLSQAMDGPAGQVEDLPRSARFRSDDDRGRGAGLHPSSWPIPQASAQPPAPYPHPRHGQADRADKAVQNIRRWVSTTNCRPLLDGRRQRAVVHGNRRQPARPRNRRRRPPAGLPRRVRTAVVRRLGPGAVAQPGGRWTVDLRRCPAAAGNHGTRQRQRPARAAVRRLVQGRTPDGGQHHAGRRCHAQHRATPFNSRPRSATSSRQTDFLSPTA